MLAHLLPYFFFVFLIALFPHPSLAASPPSDDVLKTYLTLQNGVAPTLKGSEYAATRNLVIYRSSSFKQLWLDQFMARPRGCQRYSQALVRTLDDIIGGMQGIGAPSPGQPENDDDFLRRVRLHLMIPSLFGLHALFARQSEGGFGTLDRHSTTSCRVGDRARLQTVFDQLVQDLANFHLNGLGNPGLLGFDEMSDRLLRIDEQKLIRRRHLSWALIGITTVASIIFWEMAPPAAGLAARALFGTSLPGALSNPIFIYSARASALMAEGVGWWALDRRLNPDEPEPPQMVLASWDEQMEEVEGLLDSPPDSPEMDLGFISQIKAQLVLLYGPWLQKHAAELVSLERR